MFHYVAWVGIRRPLLKEEFYFYFFPVTPPSMLMKHLCQYRLYQRCIWFWIDYLNWTVYLIYRRSIFVPLFAGIQCCYGFASLGDWLTSHDTLKMRLNCLLYHVLIIISLTGVFPADGTAEIGAISSSNDCSDEESETGKEEAPPTPSILQFTFCYFTFRVFVRIPKK